MHAKIAVAAGLVLLTVLAGCAGSAPIGSQRHSENLVNGLITVEAGAHNHYSFSLTSAAQTPRLTGTFTASGGSGNDIIVLVMDETNYINYKNGHQASTYYNSGQVTTENINANLPNGAGTYYLVYDNSFSTFSSKNVNTQANVEYVG